MQKSEIEKFCVFVMLVYGRSSKRSPVLSLLHVLK